MTEEQKKDRKKKYNKEYYTKHAERLREYRKRYREQNAEQIKAYRKKYYAEHKAEENANSKKYYECNKRLIEIGKSFLNGVIPSADDMAELLPTSEELNETLKGVEIDTTEFDLNNFEL